MENIYETMTTLILVNKKENHTIRLEYHHLFMIMEIIYEKANPNGSVKK